MPFHLILAKWSPRNDVYPTSIGATGFSWYGKGWRYIAENSLKERKRDHYLIYYWLSLILSFHFTELMKGYKAAELESMESTTGERSLWTQCQSLADMKFTYVVSCQQYSIHKRSGDPRAKEILKLMIKYVSQINLLTLL